MYLSSLLPQYHHILFDKIVSTPVESKDEAKLASQFFVLAASKELCSTSFEECPTPVAETIDDIAIVLVWIRNDFLI